jgi:hypothetical protein
MTDLRKAAEMALEVLETTWGDGSEYALKEWKETIQALHQALEQSEQEPLAWLVLTKDNNAVSLYAAPPSSEWVGLTDEEVAELRLKTFDAIATNHEVYRAIEAKLKEKNA